MAEGTEDRGSEQGDAGEAPDVSAPPSLEERTSIENTRRLVELFLCEQEQLESFRDEWLPRGCQASQEQLRAARLVLHRLADILQAPESIGWSRLEEVATALEVADAAASPAPPPASPPPGSPAVPKRTMVDGSAAEAVSAWARDPAAAEGMPPPVAPPPPVTDGSEPGSAPPVSPPAPAPVPGGPPAPSGGSSPTPPPMVPGPTPPPNAASAGSPGQPAVSESGAPPTAKDAYPPVPAVVPPPKAPPASRQSRPSIPEAPPSPATPPPLSDGSAPKPDPGGTREAPPLPAPVDASEPPAEAKAEPDKPPPPSGPTVVSPGAVPPPPDGSAAPPGPAARPAWPGAAPTGDEATQLHSDEDLPLLETAPAVVGPDGEPAAGEPPGAEPAKGDDEDEDEFQETVAVETMSPLKQVLDAGSPPPNLPDFTLQQYASLCAEREVRPGEAEAIRQKYGIPDEPTLEALDAHWERLFTAQPTVRERHQGLLTEYVAWLRHQG